MGKGRGEDMGEKEGGDEFVCESIKSVSIPDGQWVSVYSLIYSRDFGLGKKRIEI